MKVFALADLHLSFSSPDKDMSFFGPVWHNYTTKLADNWNSKVGADDWVLIAGDISWAMKLEQAGIDLEWIDKLAGRKVLIKGNHDYWWGSDTKVQAALPSSIYSVQKKIIELMGGIYVVGTRLWDVPGVDFTDIINWKPNDKAKNKALDPNQNLAIFEKERRNLEQALQLLPPNSLKRIVMTHYPPLSASLEDSIISKLLEKYRVDFCVFGHLHSVKKEKQLFGEKNGVNYFFSACDYHDFAPQLLIEV
jgi:predicted phosphohydrolase